MFLKSDSGDLRVQIEYYEGPLVVAAGDGGHYRNIELGHTARPAISLCADGGNEPHQIIGLVNGPIVRQQGLKVLPQPALLLHVQLSNLHHGRLCVFQVIEMDGHDSITHSLHLDGPYVPNTSDSLLTVDSLMSVETELRSSVRDWVVEGGGSRGGRGGFVPALVTYASGVGNLGYAMPPSSQKGMTCTSLDEYGGEGQG